MNNEPQKILNMMKNVIRYSLHAMVLLLVLASCSKEDGNEITPGDDPSSGVIPDGPAGVPAERPTDWVLDLARINPTESSMTITLDLKDDFTVNADLQSGDIVASFINGTCRGVVAADQATGLFLLSVHSFLDDDPDAPRKVTLKYYSASERKIYTSSTELLFVPATMLGTPATPHTIEWE